MKKACDCNIWLKYVKKIVLSNISNQHYVVKCSLIPDKTPRHLSLFWSLLLQTKPNTIDARNWLHTLGTLFDAPTEVGSSKATDVTIAELRSPRASFSSSSLFERRRCKDASVRRHLRSFAFCSNTFWNKDKNNKWNIGKEISSQLIQVYSF